MPLESEGASTTDEPLSATLEAADGSKGPPRAAGPSGWMRRLRNAFGLLVLAVAGAAIYYMLQHRGGPAPPPPTPPVAITAESTRTGDMNVYVSALGTVTPVYTITTFSQVTGQLIGVYYQQSQMVHKGDPLVDIDPRPFQGQLQAAQGILERDLAALQVARIDRDRYRAAYAGNAIAQQTLVDQEHLVEQLEGTVKSDEGNVKFYAAQLAYTHIVAPISGRVGLRLVDPGNLVFAGNSSILVVITQMQPITVVFAVPEGDLPEVQAQLRGQGGLPVDAFDRSNSVKLAHGSVGPLNNQIDTTTGTVKFRGDFANADLALFPNQFVNARMLVKTLRRVTLVPTAAVQYNGTNAFVYIVSADKKVTVQPVATLASDEKEIAVTGVKPGVLVATSGFDRLENGVTVSIRNQPPPQKPAPRKPAPRKGMPRKQVPPTDAAPAGGVAERRVR
jgi:multidrug efflux system membrane fusion protein